MTRERSDRPPATRPLGVGELSRVIGDDLPPWVRRLVSLLDDAVKIPGTQQGVGLDAVVGFLFPAAGDALSGLVSVTLLVVAVRRRVPASILVRMLGQQLLDVLVGAVPGVGDIFDLFYRANRKNLALIDQYGAGGRSPTLGDKLLAGALIAVGVALAFLPFVLAFVLGRYVFELLQAG